jgi:sulfofructose kinase
MKQRVVGIGHAAIDHLAMIDRYPEPDSKKEMEGFSIQCGGVVASALAVLSTFKVGTTFIGKLSDDDFGRFILEDLKSLEIDISKVVFQPGRVSPYSFIAVEREHTRRTCFFTEGNVDPLQPDEMDLTLLKGADALLIDGFFAHAQIRAAEEAKQLGVKVLLDASNLREGMGELLALCDVVISSERFASEVAPRGEVEDSLLELSRMGPRITIITLGPEGSIGLDGDKLVHQPPLAVEIVDTTGAGDIYFGSFSYGVLQGWPLEKCMQIASSAAGLSCRALGARASLPSLDEVQAVSWQECRT